MLWFDQAIWYMSTHLDLFFNEEGRAVKLMTLIHFLSDKAKESMLDHITFTFICELMLKAACLNLYDNPTSPCLAKHMNSRTGIMIEKLIKPA